MRSTTITEILKNICNKSNGGCIWGARRYIWFSHVKITRTKPGKPDKVEFRTRLINIKHKHNNVEFLKLKELVMTNGDEWFIREYKKSRKRVVKKRNKTKKNKKRK